MSAHDDFLTVQATAAALVQADPFFAGIEVLTEEKGDLDQKIRTALAKLGLAVTVMTPDFEITQRVRQRRIVKARVVVECAEIVMTNQSASGTQKAALAAAWAAALALDGKPNGLKPQPVQAPMSYEFQLDDTQPVHLVPDKVLLIYHTTLFTMISV